MEAISIRVVLISPVPLVFKAIFTWTASLNGDILESSWMDEVLQVNHPHLTH